MLSVFAFSTGWIPEQISGAVMLAQATAVPAANSAAEDVGL